MYEEWSRLKAAYESLLLDIRHQLDINEALKNSVIELENKIEIYNSQMGGYDPIILQQIEYLSRTGKKNIEYHSQKDNIKLIEGEMNVLKNKINRIENQSLTQSYTVPTYIDTTVQSKPYISKSEYNTDYLVSATPQRIQYNQQSASQVAPLVQNQFVSPRKVYEEYEKPRQPKTFGFSTTG